MNKQQQILIAAYHDRELDVDGIKAAQKLLGSSVEAQAYLDELRHGDSLLHSAFDPVLREPIPPGLLPGKRRWNPLRYAVPMAMAASLALLAVFVVRQMDSDQYLQEQLILMQQQVAQLRYQTLENTPSGTPASWTAAEGKLRAEVTPLKTYRTADKQFCREYEERIQDEQGVEVRRGIACRAGKALWPDRPGTSVLPTPPANRGGSAGVNL